MAYNTTYIKLHPYNSLKNVLLSMLQWNPITNSKYSISKLRWNTTIHHAMQHDLRYTGTQKFIICLHWSSGRRSIWRRLDRCRSGALESAEEKAEALIQDWKAQGRSSKECSLSGRLLLLSGRIKWNLQPNTKQNVRQANRHTHRQTNKNIHTYTQVQIKQGK